jgi:rifampicin phosphotransferase
MPSVLAFADVPSNAIALVGGKGLNLAMALQAGLPVPDGFIVCTEAYRKQPAFAAILAAYQRLGGGALAVAVAVRSSTTAEDGADFSFAGQQETVLNVVGDANLILAVEQCWNSLQTSRAVVYRREQGIHEATMAVVVQQMVPADVAGVLFTRDPSDVSGARMSIEAAWGLGDAVVSGRVTPDRFTIASDTSEVLSRVSANGERLCLTDLQLAQLAQLGRRVERFAGSPQDIEWAIAHGTVALLQTRPITTTTSAEREQIRQNQIAALNATDGTVWVRQNLSESLPKPTPMTWAVVSRMLAADGAFGALNRDLGCEPDPALGTLGAFDLIASRPMANLDRMLRLQFCNPPLEYPLAAFLLEPKLALDAKPVLAPQRIGLFRLPVVLWRFWRISRITQKLANTFHERYQTTIAPPFIQDAKATLAQDWATLEPAAILAIFRHWVQRTFVEFARESLKPTAIAAYLWDQLGYSAEVAHGAKPPAEKSLVAGLAAIKTGSLSRVEFLERFGHRCGNELELAQPRWTEDAPAVDALFRSPSEVPVNSKPVEDRPQVKSRLAMQLQTYLGLRETAKHDLLHGVAVVRQALLELDNRFQLHGGIFFLLPEELPELIGGRDFSATIVKRRKQRRAELSLELPAVLFREDLEAIGRPFPPSDGAKLLHGIPISAGTAEGIALVLQAPQEHHEPTSGPFVLVCPSTDPSWVPLFSQAVALVMETGGMLSHGSIVAREYGLPAVAGLPRVLEQIQTGQRLRVDGTTGIVSILS